MNWRERRRKKGSKVGREGRLRSKVTRKRTSRIAKRIERKEDIRILKHTWRRIKCQQKGRTLIRYRRRWSQKK